VCTSDPWIKYQCPWCQAPQGLAPYHLLQCPQLPHRHSQQSHDLNTLINNHMPPSLLPQPRATQINEILTFDPSNIPTPALVTFATMARRICAAALEDHNTDHACPSTTPTLPA
jgi:hypothetical protein